MKSYSPMGLCFGVFYYILLWDESVTFLSHDLNLFYHPLTLKNIYNKTKRSHKTKTCYINAALMKPPAVNHGLMLK